MIGSTGGTLVAAPGAGRPARAVLPTAGRHALVLALAHHSAARPSDTLADLGASLSALASWRRPSSPRFTPGTGARRLRAMIAGAPVWGGG
jgi:hypothetical protein